MKNPIRTSSMIGSGTVLMFLLPPSENFVAENPRQYSDKLCTAPVGAGAGALEQSFRIKSPLLKNYEYSESIYNSHSFKQKLIKNIAAFKDLSADWDGYGAIPLMESNYGNAVSLINSIQEESIRQITDFFPNPNGTLSIIWENSNSERISLEIGSSTFSYYYKSNSGDPRFYNANAFNSQNYQGLDKMIERVI